MVKSIEDILEQFKEDFDINRIQTIPLYGGMKQYMINIVTKPVYNKEQPRLWTIEDMNHMLEDPFTSKTVSSYLDRAGKVHYYKTDKGEL